MREWLDQHCDPDWRFAHRLHSVQIAAFWGAVSGAYTALPAFQQALPLKWFGIACVALSAMIAIARFTKQPGLDQ